MREFNNDMLISNISTLMKKNSITQTALAEEIGMSQPNFNRAINNTNGTRFTIEQIFDIAHYFGVTIDWLMGNQENGSITAKTAAEFITAAVSNGDAKLSQISVEELNFCSDADGQLEEPKKIKVNYWAIYFPTYWNFAEGAVDDDDYQVRYEKAKDYGNETKYWALNAYLDKFQEFYKLYKAGSIEKDDFQTLVSKHIHKIDEVL